MTVAPLDLTEPENSGAITEPIPLPGEQLVEGPSLFEQPPAPTPAAPGPAVVEAQNELVPPVPVEALADQSGTTVPPGQSVNSTIQPTYGGEDVAKRQGDLNAKKAAIDAATAQRTADLAREADEDARIEHAAYLERRAATEKELDAKIKAFDGMKITDPRERENMPKARLSVIFGGLGAAFRSAGGGDSTNRALAQLTKKWEDDVERQKANIGIAKDQAVMARTRLQDVDEGRRKLRDEANALLIGKYNAALKQGEAQLKALGIPQAQIDADQRIIALKQARDAALAKALKEQDEHNLAKAKLDWYKAKAQKLRGGSGKGGAGGALDAQALLADYATKNPGDIGGLYREARRLQAAGMKVDPKAVAGVIQQTKSTESQTKDARQAAIGLRAIDEIERSGYTPNKADTQKWLNNQRQVYQAQKAGEGGGIGGLIGGAAAGAAQGVGLLAQSETEGLSEQAAAYFANVRRFMETIGRAQSGAAISPTEWTNFFNQYGPNSKGGLDAARQYLRDQFKVSGVAGKQLEAGGSVPGREKAPAQAKPTEKAARPGGGSDDEAIAWAKKNLGDPRARKILKLNGL